MGHYVFLNSHRIIKGLAKSMHIQCMSAYFSQHDGNLIAICLSSFYRQRCANGMKERYKKKHDFLFFVPFVLLIICFDKIRTC